MREFEALINGKLNEHPNWKIAIVSKKSICLITLQFACCFYACFQILNCVFQKVIDVNSTEPVTYFLRSKTYQVNQFVSISEVVENCVGRS